MTVIYFKYFRYSTIMDHLNDFKRWRVVLLFFFSEILVVQSKSVF